MASASDIITPILVTKTVFPKTVFPSLLLVLSSCFYRDNPIWWWLNRVEKTWLNTPYYPVWWLKCSVETFTNNVSPRYIDPDYLSRGCPQNSNNLLLLLVPPIHNVGSANIITWCVPIGSLLNFEYITNYFYKYILWWWLIPLNPFCHASHRHQFSGAGHGCCDPHAFA